ncbi:MAG: nitrous oxide reductase family maturation protein NosD [Pseudomonadota bacterium]
MKMLLTLARACFLALWIPLALAAPQALQPLIDATPAGGTLHLAPGVYLGPATINRPLILEGAGKAVIQGDGRSTILSVATNGVTVRGLRLRGSGDSHDRLDAGLMLQGDEHRVENNDLEDVLFGIHLKGVNRSLVKGNRVVGKPLSTGLRGDSLRLWNSHHNRVEDNVFTQGRDVILTNSPDNQLLRNHFTDGRYGMHIIFSPRLLAEDNRLSHTGTGIVALYSPRITLRRNHVSHALTDGGGGIVIRESDDSLIENNTILHCSVGMKMDAPVVGGGKLTVRGNQFAYNIIGLFFYGEAGGHLFSNNRFDNNLTTVAISAPGVGSANQWSDNRWDDYQGFDRDRNQVGDTPHEVLLYADRIWMETPKATFFRNTPAFELLDFLERLAPFSSPHRVLQDPRPRM